MNEEAPTIAAIQVVAMAAQNVVNVVEDFGMKLSAPDVTPSKIIENIDQMIEAMEIMVNSIKNARAEMVKDIGWDPKGE